MASYALLESLTGFRYDAVDQTLYVHSRIGNFVTFPLLTSAEEMSSIQMKVRLDVVYGTIPVGQVHIEK